MYNMRDLMNPESRINQQLRDYRVLYQLAYDIPASIDQEDRVLLNYGDDQREIVLTVLKEMTNDNVILMLECMGLDIPEWMMAGAPNAETHERWLNAGLLNGQTGI